MATKFQRLQFFWFILLSAILSFLVWSAAFSFPNFWRYLLSVFAFILSLGILLTIFEES